MSIDQFIDNEVKGNDVVLFMKGTPQFPMCGFSGQVVQILDHLGVSYKGLNVLESDDLRNGIKTYSNWPTIPQLYVKGEFVGGCDIIREMFQAGELQGLLKDKGVAGQGHGGLSPRHFPLSPIDGARRRGCRMASTPKTGSGKRHAVQSCRARRRARRLLIVATADARITEIRIDARRAVRRRPCRSATAGAYERIKGIAKGELDPDARARTPASSISTRRRATRRGMVEYEIDIFILRPADPAKGSGILLYEVPNRGNKLLGTRLHRRRRRRVTPPRAQRSQDPRARRQRLRVRARLHGRVVGLGSGRAEARMPA